MPAAVIDGHCRRRESWIGEGPHGDTDRCARLSLFRVEKVGAADRAKSESEPGALITRADIFGGGALDPIGCGESGEGRKDAAGSLLTGKAVAKADTERFTLNLDAQLATGARGCSRPH